MLKHSIVGAVTRTERCAQVHGLNGSGRCPSALTLNKAQQVASADVTHADAYTLPPRSVHTATVPGAAAGWCDALSLWGSMSLGEVLQPAIELAENGFPVSAVTANSWAAQGPLLRAANGVQLEPGAADGAPAPGAQLDGGPLPSHEGCPFLRADGSAPAAGDIMHNRDLANTFKALVQSGLAGFYSGAVADSILAAVASRGGVMTAEDLGSHSSTPVKPISIDFHGVTVHEIPPNGQGIVALMALQYLQRVQWPGGTPPPHNSPQYLNALVQALRLAFADGRAHVSDPSWAKAAPAELLSAEYATARAKLICPDKAMPIPEGGWPIASSDTVSFQTVDSHGNAVSFINSNYMGFGTGIVPPGTGFTLQNRGAGFTLEEGHPNALAPGKRPYHTIIPGMATQEGRLFASFSVMGGFMQPQGHTQVISNMVAYGMDAQSALDAPRVCLPAGSADSVLAVEDGIALQPLQELLPDACAVRGWQRSVFGRGQIIRRLANGVLEGGSDGRGDGCASGCGPQALPKGAAHTEGVGASC